MFSDLFLMGLLGRDTQDWLPETNVTETSTQYRVDIDLPGVPKDKVSISTEEGFLLIAGERSPPQDKGVRLESRFGRFKRRFRLPVGVHDHEINASHRDGLLTITIPKSHATAARMIRIQD